MTKTLDISDEITYADSTAIVRDTDDGSIQVEIGISGSVVVSVSTNNDIK